MLKKTEIQLETLQDINMILMIEAGIGEGISQCSHGYAAANNKYMTDYDETKPSLYLAAKLLLTFNKRKNYIYHNKNLKFYLDLEIKVTRVNRMLQFKERNFVKPLIDLNRSLR